MAYCPYCLFMMPSYGSRVDCPNCGRAEVRLERFKPAAALSDPNIDEEEIRSIFRKSVVKRSAISFVIFYPIFALSTASWVPENYFAPIVITLSASLSLLYFLLKWGRHIRIYHTPEQGYTYHLGVLNQSAAVLEDGLQNLRTLANEQDGTSERSANRLRLLQDAIANRELRLQLIDETSFIIKAKRRLSRISALAQDMSDRLRLRETEKNLRFFLRELQSWLEKRPETYRSFAGQKMYKSLTESEVLFREVLEQLEDRRVMRAIDGGTAHAPGEGLALKQIEQFLGETLIQPEYDLFEVAEVAEADEEYLKINTELRLIQDGVRPSATDDLLTEI